MTSLPMTKNTCSQIRRTQVYKLCGELGCGDQEGNFRRGVHPKLAKATSIFRKYFAIGIYDFPLEVDDPIVQECALQFFEQDRQQRLFFHKRSGELGNSRFSSPDDKEKILELLARLFCCQEYQARKNKCQQANKPKKPLKSRDDTYNTKDSRLSDPSDWADGEIDYVLKDDDDDDDDEYEYRSGSDEANETLSEFDGIVEHPVRAPKSATPTGSRCSTSDPSSEKPQARTKTEIYIDTHCDLIYPRGASVKCVYEPCDISQEDSLEGYPNIEWLFKPHRSVWPDEPKIFVWRSMHQTNTYSYKPSEGQAQCLLDLLIAYTRITCNATQYGFATLRIRRFVMHWTRKWADNELLTAADDNLRRTDLFQAVLTSRERSWLHRSPSSSRDEPFRTPIQQKRKTEDPAEGNEGSRKVPRSLLNDKSSNFFGLGTPQTPLFPAPHSTPSADEPKLSDAIESINRAWSENLHRHLKWRAPVASMVAPSIATKPADVILRSVEPNGLPVNRSQGPITEAAMHTNVTMAPKWQLSPATTAISSLLEPSISSIASRKEQMVKAAVPTSISTEPKQPLTPTPTPTSTPSLAETPPKEPQVTPLLDSSPQQQAQSRKVPIRSSRPAHMLRDIEGIKPQIVYVVEDSNMQVDYKNPLPSFEKSTVAEFLNLFSERSGYELDFIEKVTFTLTFKDSTTIDLMRWDSEQDWERLKSRIRDLFKLVRKKEPQRIFFDILVGIENKGGGSQDDD